MRSGSPRDPKVMQRLNLVSTYLGIWLKKNDMGPNTPYNQIVETFRYRIIGVSFAGIYIYIYIYVYKYVYIYICANAILISLDLQNTSWTWISKLFLLDCKVHVKEISLLTKPQWISWRPFPVLPMFSSAGLFWWPALQWSWMTC